MPGNNPGFSSLYNRPKKPRHSGASYAMKYGKSARVVASRFLQKKSLARGLRRKNSAKKIQRAFRRFFDQPARRAERRSRKSKVTGYFTQSRRK